MEKLTPEEMLKNMKETQTERGILKIFLGYAAGVGKTYHMLDLAQDEYKKGRNVVIGYIQKHARKTTLDMMRGLPKIENKVMEYKGKQLEEFNLEKALEVKPDLILIDELAHTNLETSRHEKRYQDVEELLENGINVYTTLNVQHIEEISRYVQKEMKITIKEIVPTEWVEKANQIELIDIPVEQLLHRIEEGKIYRRENAKVAMKNFFTLEHLQLLRELGFRFMVNLVDKMNVSYTFKERILLVLDGSQKSKDLIQAFDQQKAIHNENLFVLQVQSNPFFSSIADLKPSLTSQMKLMEEAGIRYKVIQPHEILEEIKEIIEEIPITSILFVKELFHQKFFLPYLLLKKFPNQKIQFR